MRRKILYNYTLMTKISRVPKDTFGALKKHVLDEDKLTRCFTDSGQRREMYVINESSLLALIFGSKLLICVGNVVHIRILGLC